MSFDCVLGAWRAHERELLDFLSRRAGNRAEAEDLLQEVFLKAMRQGAEFCSLRNPRSWLFRVARTTLIDHGRVTKPTVELPESLAAVAPEQRSPVDELDACLRHNLADLSSEDRNILNACDLQGQTVRAYAEREGLSLPAAKSRLLRARQRLRDSLVQHCRVRFDELGNVCCYTPQKRG